MLGPHLERIGLIVDPHCDDLMAVHPEMATILDHDRPALSPADSEHDVIADAEIIFCARTRHETTVSPGSWQAQRLALFCRHLIEALRELIEHAAPIGART